MSDNADLFRDFLALVLLEGMLTVERYEDMRNHVIAFRTDIPGYFADAIDKKIEDGVFKQP